MDLKKKVGPLPVYAWAGIAAVAVLAAYFYLHRSSGSADAAGLAQPDQGSQAIDPTTGLPYSGSGYGGGGGLGIGTPDAGAAPALSADDIVAALTGALTDSGLFQAPPPAPTYDDTGVFDAIAGLQASLQAVPDHSAPPSPAVRADTVTRPSASHGGALWTYYKSKTGKLVPIAPVKAGGTTSGAHSAPSGGHASSGVPVASHPTSASTSGRSQGPDPAQVNWLPVTKNGKFYRYYPDRKGPSAYVYIRPASH